MSRFVLVEPPDDEFDLAAWDAWLAMVRRDHADASNFAEMIAWGEAQRAHLAGMEPDYETAAALFPQTSK